MLFDDTSMRLIKFLLQKFESDYKQEWEKERFSLFPYPCKTKYGELDFDTIFFWKVYAQGNFAMKAGDFFKTLAEQTGSGPAMIRQLSSLSPYQDKLFEAYRENKFDHRIEKAIRAGQPGWKILGYSVTASERLVNWYSFESNSYIAQWFCDCMSHGRWDSRWERLIDSINSSVKDILASGNTFDEKISPLGDNINRTFVLQVQRHLPGVGSEMINFFLRDWKDFVGWPYLWKHDTRNEAFWNIVAKRAEFGLKDGHKDTVLRFLVHNLQAPDLNNGALAKINTAVYRIHKDIYDRYRKHVDLGTRALHQELDRILIN